MTKQCWYPYALSAQGSVASRKVLGAAQNLLVSPGELLRAFCLSCILFNVVLLILLKQRFEKHRTSSGLKFPSPETALPLTGPAPASQPWLALLPPLLRTFAREVAPGRLLLHAPVLERDSRGGSCPAALALGPVCPCVPSRGAPDGGWSDCARAAVQAELSASAGQTPGCLSAGAWQACPWVLPLRTHPASVSCCADGKGPAGSGVTRVPAAC